MNMKAQYIEELNELVEAIKETRIYSRIKEDRNDGKFSQDLTSDQISSAMSPEGAAKKANELLTPRSPSEKAAVKESLVIAFWERGGLWQKLDDLITVAQKLTCILKDEMKDINSMLEHN